MRHDSDNIVVRRQGSAGIVSLDRPRALNSLTLPMIRSIRAALDDFAGDPAVGCVILKGEGERGFCAGGDIRAIHDMGCADDPDVTQFWREEFPLNHTISRYSKPLVVLMDGIVMGGGVGLASHAAYRIATERTRLAMPETGIGYFPDVGATWLLPQAPGESGTWAGLTGNGMNGADAIYLGLADVVVAAARLDELTDMLAALPPDTSHASLRAAIGAFAVSHRDQGVLEANRAMIDRTFHFDTVEDIVNALEAETCEFSEITRQTIIKRSPTSLKLTLRLLRLGRGSSGLMECLEREFAAASHILRGHDFYEGVRAAIIDKDRNPQWSPALLADVSEADIEACFSGQRCALFPEHRL